MKLKKVLLLVAVGFGLAAAVLTQELWKDRNPPITLIRAKRDIAKWTPIRDEKWVAENFEVQQIPRNQMPADVLAKQPVQDLHWLLSRTKDHVIAQTMRTGDPLLTDNVVEKNAGGIVIGGFPGFTAFTIKPSADSAGPGFVSTDD
jgi:hypothetical protein